MSFERFAVVRVPFPFTDRNATKNRPALVLSDAAAFNTPAGHSLMAMIISQANPGWDQSDPTRAPLRDPRTLAQTDGAPDGYRGFLLALRSPASIVFQFLCLVAAVYHAATWFNATQKAMPIQIGEDFVPGNLISGAHYAAWAVLSLVVLFLAGVF